MTVSRAFQTGLMEFHKHPPRVSGGTLMTPEKKGWRRASDLTQDLLGIMGKSGSTDFKCILRTF